MHVCARAYVCVHMHVFVQGGGEEGEERYMHMHATVHVFHVCV